MTVRVEDVIVKTRGESSDREVKTKMTIVTARVEDDISDSEDKR